MISLGWTQAHTTCTMGGRHATANVRASIHACVEDCDGEAQDEHLTYAHSHSHSHEHTDGSFFLSYFANVLNSKSLCAFLVGSYW